MSIYRLAIKNINNLLFRERICPYIFAFRNTFIVKRKTNPPLSRVRAERPRVLKTRHFIYETVEDTDLVNPPDLHVVLTTFVEGIGDVGDVISIDPFYARNHLLLPRKAVYATPENTEKYGNLKKFREERPKFSSIHAATMIRTLSRIVVPVFMNPEANWTLEKDHVHAAFRMEDFHVPNDAIEMPTTPIEGPDSVKEAGDFAVIVTINNRETVPVRCRIFHIKTGMETAKLSEELYLEKNEPILADQKDLLESMPMPEILNDPSSSISLIEKYRIQYIK